ncbi:MAG: hypothetical protein ACRDT8_23690 [Micromonosporaceae bacterium]
MFSDLLDGTTITAKSPDGKIECELADGRDVVMDFAPGSYHEYTEREMEHQLARLVTAMWVGHRRGHLAVLSERLGYPVRGEPTEMGLREREFANRRAQITAEGRSASGRIVLSTTGMTRWDVRIKPGAIREADEDSFLHDLWSAFLAMMREHQRRVAMLQDEIFDVSGRGRFPR